MPRLEEITSRDNRRLVAARKVRDGRDRDRIFIEGRRLTEEALGSGVEIEECFVVDGFPDRGLCEFARERAGAFVELPKKLLRSVADTKEPQGIILIAKRPATGKESIKIAHGSLPIVVFLHEVNNPSNLGAVVRTAEAAGVAGVVVSRDSADPLSPKALRAAMGASLRMPIWDDAGFESAIEWAREMGMTVAAAIAGSQQSYTSVDWHAPRLLVFGSEAHGLNDKQLMKVDERISIPMDPSVDSLNLAVSTGIILFEAKRQVG